MRIGLFGGTFNPIHSGHIQVVREVKEGFPLDKIYLIPSALPPHKEPDNVVDANDRIEMIRLSFPNDSDFIVSNVELKRLGPSYTIDTVRYFKSFLPEEAALYLILGMDAFFEIDTWKSYMDLFMLVPFIVMARTGAGHNDATLRQTAFKEFLESKISEGYKFLVSKSCFVHDENQSIFVFDVTPIDISSTKVRKRVKRGEEIKTLVPEVVENFINARGLYL
jgi:nicotinate-nucleotide adenylyltransferase